MILKDRASIIRTILLRIVSGIRELLLANEHLPLFVIHILVAFDTGRPFAM